MQINDSIGEMSVIISPYAYSTTDPKTFPEGAKQITFGTLSMAQNLVTLK